jgi:hypothetical protein
MTPYPTTPTTPPHDLEAEQIVLGAMLLDGAAVETVTGHIGPGDCYRPPHTRLFEHILAAYRGGEPTEPVALARRLAAAGDLERVGGAAYLHTLIASVPTVANAGFYAHLVGERAQQRRLGELAARLGQVAQAGNAIHRADQVAAIVAELADTTPAPATLAGRRAAITWADAIEARPVSWAWEPPEGGRIPAGSLSTAAGREGTGKSSFGLWLTAQITTGTLPGAFHGTPRRVLYVAVEDSWEHALVPRMMAAGTDLGMVGRFAVADEADDLTLSLPVDNLLFETAIREHQVALVVIDPLMSVISERVDTHRERDVRTALDPLARIADRTGAIILGIAHFSKSAGSDAASLITGSGAFKNVPRTIFGFARDEASDTGERVMTQVKNSLGQCDQLPSYGYTIESTTIETPNGPADTGRFHLTGLSDRSVHDVLRDGRGTDPDERAERADAATWLTGYLTDQGGEAEAADVLKAGEKVGFSRDVLKRAKTKARVTSTKPGMGTGWVWALTP